MKLHELRALVNNQGLDPFLEVVMSKDSEGNSFSPLSIIEFGEYIPNCTWEGNFTSKANFEADNETHKTVYPDEELIFEVNALCLWPTN